MPQAAIAQDWSGWTWRLSNPTFLLCVAGILLPNAFSLGALALGIGAPPRSAAIVAYAAFALIARNTSPFLFVPLYIALVAYDAIATVATSFNLAPQEIGLALNLGAELKLLDSPFYLTVIAALSLLTAANIAFLIWNREAIRRGNVVVFTALALTFAVVDFFANASPHYQFGTLYGANKPMESAAVESGFREALLTREPHSALMIIVEAMGKLDDPAEEALVFRPFRNTELLKRYDVKFGSTTYYGSTTAAEMRELCDTRTSYREMIEDNEIVCLPKILNERGYRTASLHNFVGAFFERPSWYPHVGFEDRTFGEDLAELRLRPCGSLFRGPCDVELVPLVARRLRDARNPTFLYWLTLSTHVPIAPRQAAAQLDCEREDAAIDHVEVCFMAEMWIDLFESLARMTRDIPPTEILIVGDHAPPLWSRAGRNQFTAGKVPWIRLTPRADQVASQTN